MQAPPSIYIHNWPIYRNAAAMHTKVQTLSANSEWARDNAGDKTLQSLLWKKGDRWMKMIRSSFLHPHVTPNLQDFCSSVEEVQKRHKSSVLVSLFSHVKALRTTFMMLLHLFPFKCGSLNGVILFSKKKDIHLVWNNMTVSKWHELLL